MVCCAIIMAWLSEWWYELHMIFVFPLLNIIYCLILWEARVARVKQWRVVCWKGNSYYKEKWLSTTSCSWGLWSHCLWRWSNLRQTRPSTPWPPWRHLCLGVGLGVRWPASATLLLCRHSTDPDEKQMEKGESSITERIIFVLMVNRKAVQQHKGKQMEAAAQKSNEVDTST